MVNAAKQKTILDNMSDLSKSRFWEKVNIKSKKECWLWLGYITESGYGRTTGKNKILLYAHRVAKTLHLGRELKPGMSVAHTCGNLACCNPSHLVEKSFLSTNWREVDAIRKSKLSNSALAKKYNLSEPTISLIKNNKSWRKE